VETLGFTVDWGGEAGSRIGSVSRDGHSLMLSQRPSIAEPAWVWIGCEDDSLFELWKSKGVNVRQEPLNWSWAYEMKFEDLDGNVLWLGTEPRREEPFEDGGQD
ncbi:MAG: bleomycin resistance family protein, partial [Verrucomicrobiae bacterium]|nr:bleomycin resistance family protein [Verrucomicrobiae bacterium]